MKRLNFTVSIKTGNDACLNLNDISLLLRSLADKIQYRPDEEDQGKIMDLNGQSVGTWKYSRE